MYMTPSTMIQAEDRAHRIGQQFSVNCHYLLARDTLDERLFAKLEKKFSIVSSIVDGESR